MSTAISDLPSVQTYDELAQTIPQYDRSITMPVADSSAVEPSQYGEIEMDGIVLIGRLLASVDDSVLMVPIPDSIDGVKQTMFGSVVLGRAVEEDQQIDLIDYMTVLYAYVIQAVRAEKELSKALAQTRSEDVLSPLESRYERRCRELREKVSQSHSLPVIPAPEFSDHLHATDFSETDEFSPLF